MKRKVLIIDDSALMRQLLQAILSRSPDLEVVGTAPDAMIAYEKIRTLKPDVLTLDVQMPRMDGLTFLSQLMSTTPLPVVMVSSLTEAGCETTLKALELGAFDFVTKPKLDPVTKTLPIAEILIDKVRVAAHSKVFLKKQYSLLPTVPKPAMATFNFFRRTAAFFAGAGFARDLDFARFVFAANASPRSNS